MTKNEYRYNNTVDTKKTTTVHKQHCMRNQYA